MRKEKIMKICRKILFTIIYSTQSFAFEAIDEPKTHYQISRDEQTQVQAILGKLNVRSSNLQSTYIKASNTDAGDWFAAFAIDGDTLVVGAPGEDSMSPGINGDESDNSAPLPIPGVEYTDVLFGSGAAYVFVKNNGKWEQQAYLKASNPDAGDYFGLGVAISGDTIIVSAPYEGGGSTGINGDESNDPLKPLSGAVYVFKRTGDQWAQQAYVKASNTDSTDYFGISVTIDGDTMAVGAIGEASNAQGINGNQSNNFAIGSGAVYVFIRVSDSWSQQAYIKASNTDQFDNFGNSISLYEDTLAVGASSESSNSTGINGDESNNLAPGSGAVYVFTRSNSQWLQQAYIKASNTQLGDSFFATDLKDDLLVVGAPDEDGTGPENSGAVYIFGRQQSTWTETAYIKSSDPLEDERFGTAVSINDDLLAITNNTGYFPNEKTNEYEDGEPSLVYVYEHYNNGWVRQFVLQAPNAELGDSFYGILSEGRLITSNVSEDSSATGVNGDDLDNSAPESGAVYVISPVQTNIVYRNGFD